MSTGNTIPIPHRFAKNTSLADLQNCDAWQRAFHNKCKDHRYYEIVEETLEGGFEHHYLLLEDDSGNVRAIQPVFFVRQNLVEGVPGKISSIVDRVRKIFPRFLTMRVLMVGCAAGTGRPGHLRRRKTNHGWQTHCRRAFRLMQGKTKLPWSS